MREHGTRGGEAPRLGLYVVRLVTELADGTSDRASQGGSSAQRESRRAGGTRFARAALHPVVPQRGVSFRAFDVVMIHSYAALPPRPSTPRSPRMKHTTRTLGAIVLAFIGAVNAAEPVTSGDEIDYMPSVIRSSDDGARIVVFERLNPSTFAGDLLLTRSTDDGVSWSTPAPIIASAASERHPSLLQRAAHDYVLFYLKGTGSSSSYRLWRATSTDGISFTEQNQLDLGWTTGGEINPHAIRHANGTLTMSYQRLGGGSYVAESSDGGATWDTLKTQIASGSQLPRIAYRDSDGLYLASYQVGSSALSMYVKTTHDVRDWSAPRQDFAVAGNNHDSLPVVMPDGAFALFWIRENGGLFDLAVRHSLDGASWSNALALPGVVGEHAVEPHPLIGASSVEVELYWGSGQLPPADPVDMDIVREAHAVVVDSIFVDGLEDMAVAAMLASFQPRSL